VEQLPLHTWLPTRENAAVHSFAEDPAGGLWIAVFSGGLVRLTGDKPAVYSPKEGLPNDEVYDVTFDREGNLWAALARGGGLLQLRDGKFLSYGSKEGLPGGSTTAIVQAEDGTVWAGTPENGILRLTGQRFGYEGVPPELRSEPVQSLLTTRDGSLWVGLWGSKVARLYKGRVTYYAIPGNLANAVPELYEDRDGSVWVGYIAGGAAQIRDGKISAIPLPELPRVTISEFLRARDGEMWMASPGAGLIHWHDSRAIVLREFAGTSPSWLMEDREGDLWVATKGQGLYRLHNGSTYHWNRENGLPDNLLYSIFESGDGDLWMQSYSGVVRVRRSDLLANADGRLAHIAAEVFDTADGLPSREQVGAQALQDRSGRLWFPTLSGLAVIDPRYIRINPVPPPTRIEAITFDRQSQAAVDGMRLGPGDGTLSFRFTALSFRSDTSSKAWIPLERGCGGPRGLLYARTPGPLSVSDSSQQRRWRLEHRGERGLCCGSRGIG
jgi:ligand-binding sensor domain-containing protein